MYIGDDGKVRLLNTNILFIESYTIDIKNAEIKLENTIYDFFTNIIFSGYNGKLYIYDSLGINRVSINDSNEVIYENVLDWTSAGIARSEISNVIVINDDNAIIELATGNQTYEYYRVSCVLSSEAPERTVITIAISKEKYDDIELDQILSQITQISRQSDKCRIKDKYLNAKLLN